MSLKSMLERHEGLSLKVYTCPAGKLTIGYGRNLEDRGITEAEAAALLDNDIERCRRELLDHFKWYRHLSQSRKDVCISMVFQLGLSGFKKFRKTIRAIENKDWEEAKAQMLDSKWATEDSPRRAQELADMMEQG